eukprot:COSAG04_NODE_5205_length_1703_cov_1.890898_1_plen_237_part_00
MNRCHDDGYWGSSIRLGVVALLEDCPPVGGAFGVWPGSHRRLFFKPTEEQKGEPTLADSGATWRRATKEDSLTVCGSCAGRQRQQERGPRRGAGRDPAGHNRRAHHSLAALAGHYGALRLKRRFSCLPQVDCHGAAGTIVLWHPRLGHMGTCGAFSRNCLRPSLTQQALRCSRPELPRPHPLRAALRLPRDWRRPPGAGWDVGRVERGDAGGAAARGRRGGAAAIKQAFKSYSGSS